MDFGIWVIRICELLEGFLGLALAITCFLYVVVQTKIDRYTLLAFVLATGGLTLFCTMIFLLQVPIEETMNEYGLPYFYRGFVHGLAIAVGIFLWIALLNWSIPPHTPEEHNDSETS